MPGEAGSQKAAPSSQVETPPRERPLNNLNGFQDFRMEDDPRQGHYLVLTVLFVPNSLDNGSTQNAWADLHVKTTVEFSHFSLLGELGDNYVISRPKLPIRGT